MGGKFRLRLATQRGEKIAKDHGFVEFPVDPFAIARSNEIHMEAKPPDKKGVSGCIIFRGDIVAIIYSTEIQNEGFQRFTVAHELGHYFLDGHPDEILLQGGVHASKGGFVSGSSSIETEADHFAAGLLMPSNLAKPMLSKSVIGLAGIKALADEAKCSLTSAAIRAAELSPYPIAIVVSEETKVRYSFLSERFKELGKLTPLLCGNDLPPSATLEFNGEASNIQSSHETCSTANLSNWFSGPNFSLDEEIIGLGKYGLTLTILTSEEIPSEPLEEEDEEQKLIDQWTPKFAYGR